MGGLCCCLDKGDQDTSSSRTPLLAGGAGVGARSGSLSVPPAATSDFGPISARQHNPSNRGFETSIQCIKRIYLDSIQIPTMEKSFQDQTKLYNEVVDCYKALESDIENFTDYFNEELSDSPGLADCVKLLRERCGDAHLKIQRKSKNFIEVTYNPKEVSEKCSGNPDDSLTPLINLNSACRHIRDVMQHAPQVKKNIRIILHDEETLRREVMKADLSSKEGVEAMKIFHSNISKLRTMAAGTDTVYRYAEKTFKEMASACRGFFNEKDKAL